MHLGDFCVIHKVHSQGILEPILEPGGENFYLQTCQRSLIFTRKPAHILTFAPSFKIGEADYFEGSDAYAFVLKILLGLESDLFGETEILGQFKTAWSQFKSPIRSSLSPVVQNFLQDAKELRNTFLTNLGCSTYGGLTRSLLSEYSPSKIVIAGAGQLTESIVPYLSDYSLVLTNRSTERLSALVGRLNQKNANFHIQTQDLSDLRFEKGNHLVVCIPAMTETDQLLLEKWRAQDSQGAVIHLGLRNSQKEHWERKGEGSYPLHSLDDVTALQKENLSKRSLVEHKIHKACHERAQLRRLGGFSTAHGWEDLAAFTAYGKDRGN